MVTLKGQTPLLSRSRTTWTNPSWLFNLLKFFFVIVVVRKEDIWRNLNKALPEIAVIYKTLCIYFKETCKSHSDSLHSFLSEIIGKDVKYKKLPFQF